MLSIVITALVALVTGVSIGLLMGINLTVQQLEKGFTVKRKRDKGGCGEQD